MCGASPPAQGPSLILSPADSWLHRASQVIHPRTTSLTCSPALVALAAPQPHDTTPSQPGALPTSASGPASPFTWVEIGVFWVPLIRPNPRSRWLWLNVCPLDCSYSESYPQGDVRRRPRGGDEVRRASPMDGTCALPPTSEDTVRRQPAAPGQPHQNQRHRHVASASSLRMEKRTPSFVSPGVRCLGAAGGQRKAPRVLPPAPRPARCPAPGGCAR